MCGLSGIISKHPQSNEFWESVKLQASKIQYHRGPDNFGSWLNSTNTAGLFHNRLSILDPGPNSNQPLLLNEAALVFNGEIYNYKDLQKANKFPSDTHFLINEWNREYQNEFLGSLDGMFAIAYLENTTLTLARDRMGIKPLYYFVNDSYFIFASEIKLILQFQKMLGLNSAEVYNEVALANTLILGHCEGELELFNNVKSLSPGTSINFDSSNWTFNTSVYFNLSNRVNADLYASSNTELKLTQQLDDLLNYSVEKHLLSDVSLGSLCSGGIDSTLITAIATKLNPDIKIYHAGVAEGGGEEHYAQIAAKHLNIELNIVQMSEDMFWDNFVEATYNSDLPIYHPNDVSLYKICKHAQSQGVKVLLAGEGADELFGGYSWHLYNYKSQQPKFKFLNWFLKRYQKLHGNSWLNMERGQSFINLTYPSYNHYFWNSSNQMALRTSLWLNRSGRAQMNSLTEAYKTLNLSEFETQMITQISQDLNGHLSSILHRNDRMGMMASIETRVPFIENKLIDFGLNLPLKYKINNNQGKYLLKKVAERYLPKEIVYRPKAGFPVPWDKYLNRNWNALFKESFYFDFLNMDAETGLNTIKNMPDLLISAIAIEIWGKIFVQGQTVESVKNLIR